MAYILNRNILPDNEHIVKTAIAALNPEKRATHEQKARFIKNAYEEFMNDPKSPKMKALAAQRSEVVDLRVFAKFPWLDFFKVQTLKGSEMPMYHIKGNRSEIPVTVVSNDGGGATTLYSDSYGNVTFPLYQLETDKVMVPTWDLVQGFVDRSDEVNEELEQSQYKKMCRMAKAALDGCFGDFVWSGNPEAVTAFLDPDIKNPPTTNTIDVSTECGGKFTINAVKAVLKHFNALNKKVRAIYIPAARQLDLLDWVTITGSDIANAADTIPKYLQEEIWKKGGQAAGGIIPPIVATNILEGEQEGEIFAYAVTDNAPGILYQKPEGHWTRTKEEDRWMTHQKFFTASFVVPNHLRTEIARIKLG